MSTSKAVPDSRSVPESHRLDTKTEPVHGGRQRGVPLPEFTTISYTAPYHLLTQADDVAAQTNRSQSELISDSIRFYLRAWHARQERGEAEDDEADDDEDSHVWTDPEVRLDLGGSIVDRVLLQIAEHSGVAAALVLGDCDHPAAQAATPPSAPTRPPLRRRDPADPAAETRRKLRTLANEPISSDALRAALAAIMREVDRKDFSPAGHSIKVARWAAQLAQIKGFRGVRLLEVELAGLVHDIGKAAIPDAILEKPRPSPDEMSVIRRYPERGVEILSLVPALEPITAIVGHHQERWNGSGYPRGLHGSAIPVGAQIVALCDVYDVLLTERRYRPAYPEDRARQIIEQSIGTLWNPDLTRMFLDCVVGIG